MNLAPRSAPDWSRFWETDRVVLAPMEGVVDRIMRELITDVGGIDLCVTEFIRVTDRLLPDSVFFKDCPELKTASHTRAGTPILLQLLGGKPEWMALNAKRACELGAIGIDLNFGCPAKTVNRHDGGATLLKDPTRVYDVTRAVRDATPAHISVSVKVRLGFSDKNFHREIAEAAEAAGGSWLTVHARTRDEGYRPPAHWEYIANMRERVKIPVIANGEIWTSEDARRCREVSGCRHIMIGRGLMSNPFLARDLAKHASARPWSELEPLVKKFSQMSLEERGEPYAVSRLKQWLKSLSRASESARVSFESVKRFESLAPMLAGLEPISIA